MKGERMRKLLSKLGERRRDCIWCFILGLLFLGYAFAIMKGGMFVLGNMPSDIVSNITWFITSMTTLILGAISISIGVVLLFYGLGVLVKGGDWS